MALAHELWDRAVNPNDIGFIIEESKPILRRAFRHVVANCLPVGRGVPALRDRPSLPHRLWLPGEGGGLTDERRRRQADVSTWLTFRAHEQREMYERHSRDIPFYTEPKLFIGLRALVEHLDDLALTGRGEDLFELSGLFGHTIENTRAAPITKRGRQ